MSLSTKGTLTRMVSVEAAGALDQGTSGGAGTLAGAWAQGCPAAWAGGAGTAGGAGWREASGFGASWAGSRRTWPSGRSRAKAAISGSSIRVANRQWP